ncbi:hypothetical protein Taro_003701, partial [Colocasia esculenta]|nr:hypothetical protein [Colocasia esculenta]
KTAELFFFGWLKEEKLKPPSPSAARGCCTDVDTSFLGHSLQVAKEGYNIKMGQRKRFTVVDSKRDREESPKKKTGPSCDTNAKKAKKKTMKEVYDGEPEMNHWQLVVICNKGDNDMTFLMLLDSLHKGEPTKIENELKNFLKIAYEGKEMRAVVNELKVIDLHVPKLTVDWFSREEYEKSREDLQGKKIHIDAQSASTSKVVKRGPTMLRSIHGLQSNERVTPSSDFTQTHT